MVENNVLVVILNYKTYDMTLRLVRKLKNINYDNLKILVIDNCSPNESAAVLRDNADEEKFDFIANDRNAGYAAGNNIGIRYSIAKGFEYTWILNNDVDIMDMDILKKMIAAFENDSSIACVGQKIFDTEGRVCSPYVNRPNMWTMTVGLYAEKRKREQFNDCSRLVYRVHGCSMLVKNQDMDIVGGLDERTFLYNEEEILAERLLHIGKKMYYCSETAIIHMESSTVGKKKGWKSINKIKMINKSFSLYLKEYRNYNFFEVKLCEVFRSALIFLRG
jgi:hypothetical protein